MHAPARPIQSCVTGPVTPLAEGPVVETIIYIFSPSRVRESARAGKRRQWVSNSTTTTGHDKKTNYCTTDYALIYFGYIVVVVIEVDIFGWSRLLFRCGQFLHFSAFVPWVGWSRRNQHP
jgi:hypothetical protein